MPRALISVSDKTGLIPFAQGLIQAGFELLSTGGTYRVLRDAGLASTKVEQVTGFPEILDGRVKTLHPAVHAGILARPSDEHRAQLAEHGIQEIDVVAVNLYPFRETLAKPGVSSEEAIENIDIGGPAMLRAAAKNFERVWVVVDPSDYPRVLAGLSTGDGSLRRQLAGKAYAHTAAYDSAIAHYFAGLEDSSPVVSQALVGGEPGSTGGGEPGSTGGSEPGSSVDSSSDAAFRLPKRLEIRLELAQSLRYGENPHQQGARYREAGKVGWWDGVVQHKGTQLGYLNVFDADAAWRLAFEFQEPCCVIVKHANPCGVAISATIADAYTRAFAADPKSAFGGVVALNRRVDGVTAGEIMSNPKADVVIAPGYDDEALRALASGRKAMRVLEAPSPSGAELELRRVGGGFLVQQPDLVDLDRSAWRVVTKRQPSEREWRDLAMAWIVCARTSSNAIVLVKDLVAVGIGAGQQSRVDAAQIASSKAAGRAAGGACASDAFYPFRDGLDAAAEAGVAAVIQPGGSVRDDEVIAAADEHGLAMVFTGTRHFRH